TGPVYIPLLLPLTILAVPAPDLTLAVVRRTWRGPSPVAADRGHRHHRPLRVGHSHGRAGLLMAFWSAPLACRALAAPATSASMWIVLSVVFLSAIGLILLLLPRFTPRTPRWMEAFVPPRYRRRRAASAAGAPAAATGALRTEEAGDGGRAPVAAGVAGVNGATAVGHRARLGERRSPAGTDARSAPTAR